MVKPPDTQPSALRTYVDNNTHKKMYITSDVARSLEVSVKTVRRWIKEGKILPSFHIEQGKNQIPIWSAEDIIYLQNWYLNKSRGKQPKYREEVSTDDNI